MGKKLNFFLSAFFLSFFSIGNPVYGQAPIQPNAAKIYQALQKLNVLGSVMYVAAHPDDENTRLISWLANEKHLDVTYLSLTRGDGGQNLIGPEIRELLGLIRTQELLMARKTDGGNQYFTRANDFGYSKSPAEALRIWGKDEILSDVVWAMRKFRPDIVINRFSADTSIQTHGHHTASAILSTAAYDLAGDRDAYTEQLDVVETWQPKRLFFNTSWYFYNSRDAFKKAMAKDNSLFSINVGTYFPLLGKSNTEIAALSRSMHRCQGFGSAGSRGDTEEYLQLLKGNRPDAGVFDGLDLSWNRLPGGKAIGENIEQLIQTYDLQNPSASVPGLMDVYQQIKKLPEGYWKSKKLDEIKDIIRWCSGLYLAAVSDKMMVSPGQTMAVEVEAINRSGNELLLENIGFSIGEKEAVNQKLSNNTDHRFDYTLNLPDDMAYSSPYWLKEPWEQGLYTVKKQQLRGKPESPVAITMLADMRINDVPISFEFPVVYRKVDPAIGETYSPLAIVPPVFVQLDEKVYVFTQNEPKKVQVTVKAGTKAIQGKLGIGAADGWSASPAQYDVDLSNPGQQQTFTFTVTPPGVQTSSSLQAVVTVDGKPYHQQLIKIEYEHIPTQMVLQPAQAKTINIDLEKKGERIAYIMGAGDDIPASLEQIGYQVDVLGTDEITSARLSQYDALITGVRAYNTQEWLRFAQPLLMEYVKNGGTMIVQYNTNRRLVLDNPAPYPINISRDRVTVEGAEVTLLAPEHPVLNFPNKITQKDFEGWVQERGLYFPDKWDDRYTAILSSHDPGEPPRKGGLLVAQYGKGHFVYTGYSWFRELPAGVAGAYRIFTNLISLGQ